MMDTILETNAAVESVRQAYDGNSDRPRPEWVRGVCPQCGDQLVANAYYVGRKGLLGIARMLGQPRRQPGLWLPQDFITAHLTIDLV